MSADLGQITIANVEFARLEKVHARPSGGEACVENGGKTVGVKWVGVGWVGGKRLHLEVKKRRDSGRIPATVSSLVHPVPNNAQYRHGGEEHAKQWLRKRTECGRMYYVRIEEKRVSRLQHLQ